jgi:hypothetical protein
MKRTAMLAVALCILTSITPAQNKPPQADAHLTVPTACKNVFHDDPPDQRGKAIKESEALSKLDDTDYDHLKNQTDDQQRIGKEVALYEPQLEVVTACVQAADEEGNLAGRYVSLRVMIRRVSYENAVGGALIQYQENSDYKLMADFDSLLKDYNALINQYNYVVGVAKGLAAAPSSYPVFTQRSPLTCETTRVGVVSATRCY